MTTKIPVELSSTPGIADSSNATAITIDSSENCVFAGTINTLGLTGPKTNFTNSMLISQDAGTGTLSSAVSNTGFGYNVFDKLTSGRFNVGMGQECLLDLTEGDSNTAMGSDAAANITTGDENTAIGKGALLTAQTSSYNTAIGKDAFGSLTTGEYQVAVGRSAGYAVTDGEYNTAVGYYALVTCTSGDENTAVGANALQATTGDDNVAVGRFAGANLTSGSRNVIIGRNAATQGESSATNNNCIYIGEGASGNNGASNEYVIGQDRIGLGGNSIVIGKDTTNRIYNVFTSNATWTRSSDERLKKDIQTNTDLGLNFVNDLRTTTYKWKAPSELPTDFEAYDAEKTKADHEDKLYGFIAQEVKQALDDNNITNFNGWHTDDVTGIEGISYEMFVVPLVKAVQELSSKCDSLQKEINELKGN